MKKDMEFEKYNGTLADMPEDMFQEMLKYQKNPLHDLLIFCRNRHDVRIMDIEVSKSLTDE